VIDRVPKLSYLAAYAKPVMRDKLIAHKQYITRYGDDMPEVKHWRWPGPVADAAAVSAKPASSVR
jgi:xylulose-5-phosphate/fructose-6-phosphate phosphoketolase